MKKKEMDQLMNIEFLNFKNDIFKIVQQAKEQDNNKNLKKRPQTSYPIKKDAEKKRKFIPSEIRINTNIETKTDKDKKIQMKMKTK